MLEKRKYEAIFLESWGANLPGRYSECLSGMVHMCIGH